MTSMRICSVLLAAVLGGIACAATLTITSPTEDDFLGKTNKVNFNIRGAIREVRVRVRATLKTNTSVFVQVEKRFTPNIDGEVTDSIDLDFDDSTPEGIYTIQVTPTEPGNTYNVVPEIEVTVDVQEPKFINANPVNNTFVRGIVPITAKLQESNVDLWRVTIDGSGIPNNSGSATDINVQWNTASIRTDGSKTILIKVDDLAKNSTSRSVDVTLDRLRPNSVINSPRANASVKPNTDIAIFVRVNDQFQGSVASTGIVVEARTLQNKFITRAARRSADGDGNGINWFGRLRATRSLPSTFKLVVLAIDRAGNSAVVQETRVRIANR
ncbi:MAG: hypothetical protein KIT11_09790 [Fimbriimonadaceae bacterium]|nr:hypothetical protein [Fimbriimonadaceae bacterium]QYK55615.1 MAG: hypothetical protein KF733_11460 [Fimbriimonadaceae bacterium]